MIGGKSNVRMAGYTRKILPITAVVLIVAHAALVLSSWIVASVYPASRLRSMLSGEGIRWLFGSFVDNLTCPISAWLLLGAVTYGVFVSSGLKSAVLAKRNKSVYAWRRKCAMWAAILCAVVMSGLLVMLAFIPHALLLGIEGNLYPSAFCDGIVPYIAFSVMFVSIVYGLVSGEFTSLEDIFKSMYVGISFFSPLVPIYILVVQLYFSTRFVLTV